MSAALRLLFNATALLALLALAAALGVSLLHARPLPWEQLALGRQIAEASALPAHDTLLFSAPLGAPFDGSSWLWDWGAWSLGRVAGPKALRAVDVAVWLAALWALVAAAFRRGARPFSTAVFCAWALACAATDLHPGPDLLAFAGFCAALWIMEGEFWPAFFGRWLWLAPLAVVLVNLSPAAWVLAPLVLVRFATEPSAGIPEAPRHPRFAKTVFFGLLLLCLCLHPQGLLALERAPWALRGSPLLPGAFAARQGGLLLLAVGLTLVLASSWIEAGRPASASDGALLVLAAGAALASRDALPWFLALAAPRCAARFDILADAAPAAVRALRWPTKVLVFGGVLAFFGPTVLRAVERPSLRRPLPQQTVDFYRHQVLDEAVLCPPDWTPYLAWRLAPEARFALDPRGLTPRPRERELQDALRARGDYAGTLVRAGVGVCWLPLGSPLALALEDSQAWQPVSFDDASVLYVPVDAAHAQLIHDRAPRGLRPGDPAHPFDATRLVEAEADLEADLARDPDMGVLYLYMARLWLARGHASKARETLEGGIRADPGFAPNDALLAGLRARMGTPADRAAARDLYRRALALEDDPGWRAALQALGPP